MRPTRRGERATAPLGESFPPQRVRVACPICGRTYNIRTVNLGKMARCLCTVKFRLRLKPKASFSQGKLKPAKPTVVSVGPLVRPVVPVKPAIPPARAVPPKLTLAAPALPAAPAPCNPPPQPVAVLDPSQAVDAAIDEIIHASVQAALIEPTIEPAKTQECSSPLVAPPPAAAEVASASISPEERAALIEPQAAPVLHVDEPASAPELATDKPDLTKLEQGLLARFFRRHAKSLAQAPASDDSPSPQPDQSEPAAPLVHSATAAESPAASEALPRATPAVIDINAATSALTEREQRLHAIVLANPPRIESPQQHAVDTAPLSRIASVAESYAQSDPRLRTPPVCHPDEPAADAVELVLHAATTEPAIVAMPGLDDTLPIPLAFTSTGLLGQPKPAAQPEPEAFDDRPMLLLATQSDAPVPVATTVADIITTVLPGASTAVITEAAPPPQDEPRDELTQYEPVLLHCQQSPLATPVASTCSRDMLPVRIAQASTGLVTQDNPPEPEKPQEFDDAPVMLHAERPELAVGLHATDVADMLPVPLAAACVALVSQTTPPPVEPPVARESIPLSDAHLHRERLWHPHYEAVEHHPLLLHAEQSEASLTLVNTDSQESRPVWLDEVSNDFVTHANPPQEHQPEPETFDATPVLLHAEYSESPLAIAAPAQDAPLPELDEAWFALVNQDNPPQEQRREPETFDATPVLLHAEQSPWSVGVDRTSAREMLPLTVEACCTDVVTLGNPPAEQAEDFDSAPILLHAGLSDLAEAVASSSPAASTRPIAGISADLVTLNNPPTEATPDAAEFDPTPVLLLATEIEPATAVESSSPQAVAAFAAASTDLVTLDNPPVEDQPEAFDDSPVMLHADLSDLAQGMATTSPAEYEPVRIAEIASDLITLDNPPAEDQPEVFDDSPVMLHADLSDLAESVASTSPAECMPARMAEIASDTITLDNPPAEDQPETFDDTPVMLHADLSDLAESVATTSPAEYEPVRIDEIAADLITLENPPIEDQPEAFDDTPVLLHAALSDLAQGVATTSPAECVAARIAEIAADLITLDNPPVEDQPEAFDALPQLIHAEQSPLAVAIAMLPTEFLASPLADHYVELVGQDNPPRQAEPEPIDLWPVMLFSAETLPEPVIGTTAPTASAVWLVEPAALPVAQETPPPPDPIPSVDLTPVLLLSADIEPATAVDFAAPELAEAFAAACSGLVTQASPPIEDEPEPIDQLPISLFISPAELPTAETSTTADEALPLWLCQNDWPIGQHNLPVEDPEPVIDQTPLMLMQADAEPAAMAEPATAECLAQWLAEPTPQPTGAGDVPVDTSFEAQLGRMLKPLPEPMVATLLKLVSDVVAASTPKVIAAPRHGPQIAPPTPGSQASVFDAEFLPTVEDAPAGQTSQSRLDAARGASAGRSKSRWPELAPPANGKPRLHVTPQKRQPKPPTLPPVAPPAHDAAQRRQRAGVIVAGVAICVLLGCWAAYRLLAPASLAGAWEDPRTVNPFSEETPNWRLLLRPDQTFELARAGELALTRGRWSQEEPAPLGTAITLQDAPEGSGKWLFSPHGTLTQLDVPAAAVLKKHLLWNDYLAYSVLGLLGLALAYALRCYVRERLLLFGRNY